VAQELTAANRIRQQQRDEWTVMSQQAPLRELGADLWPAHALLVAQADIRPGYRVVDLACGRGTPGLAERIGPEGHLLGLDIAPGMVERGRAWARDQGLANVEFGLIKSELELDVPPASFDVATCSFGLMYMPDPAGALRCLHRALKSGGRAVATTWGPLEHCPFLAIVLEVVTRHVHRHPVLDLSGPNPFALPTREALAATFSSAGFVGVETSVQDVPFSADTPEAYWTFVSTGTWPLAPLRDALSEEQWRTIHDELIAALSLVFSGGPVVLTGEMVIAAGWKRNALGHAGQRIRP
jgi:SAM-dependent methyltransferase